MFIHAKTDFSRLPVHIFGGFADFFLIPWVTIQLHLVMNWPSQLRSNYTGATLYQLSYEALWEQVKCEFNLYSSHDCKSRLHHCPDVVVCLCPRKACERKRILLHPFSCIVWTVENVASIADHQSARQQNGRETARRLSITIYFPWRYLESRYLESRTLESGIRNGWNPESKGLESGIQGMESGIQRLGIRNPGPWWIPLHGANNYSTCMYSVHSNHVIFHPNLHCFCSTQYRWYAKMYFSKQSLVKAQNITRKMRMLNILRDTKCLFTVYWCTDNLLLYLIEAWLVPHFSFDTSVSLQILYITKTNKKQKQKQKNKKQEKSDHWSHPEVANTIFGASFSSRGFKLS